MTFLGPNKEDFLRAILRTDFRRFIQKVFKTLNPGSDYCDNWHISAIAHLLGKVQSGQTKRVLITQPPRSLKSITTSVAWVAWYLGQNPSKTFICISYSQDLAADLSNKFKIVVQSQWYKDLFSRTRFSSISEGEAKTTKGGGRITTSIGGTLTGRGADIVIIDDPLKAEDAASVTARTRVIDWYQGTLMSRLNNQKHGAIIVVMQRLHEDDLAGHILDMGNEDSKNSAFIGANWEHLDLPAIAVENQSIAISNNRIYYRNEGDLLHPAREGQNELARLKRELGSQRFSAQYQQRPIPLEGNLIKRNWFRRYNKSEIMILKSKPYARIVQSWDIATSTAETADWSVCTTWLKYESNHYLLDVLRVRRVFPDLKRLIVDHALQFTAQNVLIEQNGLGLPIYQDLYTHPPLGFPRPIGIKAKEDKLVRMEAQSATIENGHVFLPSDSQWLDTYLRELMAFPTSKYDDQVDSTSQYLKWAEHHSPQYSQSGPVGLAVSDDTFDYW